jgi:hypothetical protein
MTVAFPVTVVFRPKFVPVLLNRSSEPPANVIVPAPNAPATVPRNVPALTVVPPPYVFVLVNTHNPASCFSTRGVLVLLITPLTVFAPVDAPRSTKPRPVVLAVIVPESVNVPASE